MFYFFGRKKQLAKYYSPPKYHTIIEPFSGSAAYSLHADYWKNDVILFDIDPIICDIWKYLIYADPCEIMDLPDIPDSEKIPDWVPYPQRAIIGFCLTSGSARPGRKASKGTFNRWNHLKPVIADNLYKIRHWKISNKEYSDITENVTATWFIDPPYQHSGVHYQYGSTSIVYRHLGKWCMARKGQVIVCESNNANWLNFQPLKQHSGVKSKYIELFFEKN